MLEKVYKPEMGVKGRKGRYYSPSPVTPIHEHKWAKQPDLCLYERHKGAFWIALSCTACGRLGGRHLKDLPLRAIPVKVKEITPMRPPEPTIPPATEDRARDALKALARRNLKLDPALRQNLELAAYGRYTSQPRGAEAAISAAESAVWQHESTRQAAAKEEAERPWLVVHFAFRGPGGRSFTVGRERIDQALADELREWQETMEAVAAQHRWDAPSGYNPDNWPPFTIEEADA